MHKPGTLWNHVVHVTTMPVTSPFPHDAWCANAETLGIAVRGTGRTADEAEAALVARIEDITWPAPWVVMEDVIDAVRRVFGYGPMRRPEIARLFAESMIDHEQVSEKVLQVEIALFNRGYRVTRNHRDKSLSAVTEDGGTHTFSFVLPWEAVDKSLLSASDLADHLATHDGFLPPDEEAT